MVICPKLQEVTADYSTDSHTSERHFILRGPITRSAAESEVAASTTGFDGVLIRKGWTVRELHPGYWDVRVFYGSTHNLDVGDVQIRGSTKGGTFNATHALQHISSTAASGMAPDHKGAINVTKDGIGGVEIPIQTFAFTVTKAFAPGTINNTYMDTLNSATTKVNDADWYGFPRGSVLFAGSDFDLNLETEVISYEFQVSENLLDVTVGPITVLGDPGPPADYAKEGWQYLWVETLQKTDAASGYAVMEPIAIHVERVYEYFNFALLGI